MKILIIRNFPSYMDVKHNTYNIQEVGLAKALTRQGNKVDIVFWTDGKEREEIVEFDKDLSITVFYKKGKSILKNAWYTKIDELIAKYDIIQLCEYNQMQSWHFAKKYSDKMIIYHGPYFSKFNRRYNMICKVFDMFFLKRYIKLKTKFIVKSELAKEFLINKGIDKANIAVVGVGIDAQILTTEQENTSILSKKMNNKEELKLLYIGKIEQRRNPAFLIDIMENLVNKNINTHLYIIGNGTKEDTDKFSKYIDKKGMTKYISWEKKCEQKYLSSIYKKANVFLLPTSYEIFGMVLLEAMYYGNVVLTTQNGGASTLITNGENGFILNLDNIDTWVSCIIDVNNNKDYMNKIKENAALKVKNEFTWDALTNNFMYQYKTKLKNE